MKSPGMTIRRKATALVIVLGIPLIAAISCATVSRKAVLLPEIPGVEYIGSAECEQCHEEIYRNFQTADHARLIAPGPNALHAGCESCHGPCGAHSESGGETKPPFSFASGRFKAPGASGRLAESSSRENEGVCYQCHMDVRGHFNLPYHHAVPEGRMTCSECHDPHKGSAHRSGGTRIESQNAGCIECHNAQRGPFTFPHAALEQGCTTCHNPHGSVNDKLLTERNSNLCLKCHFQQVQRAGQILIGGSDHTLRLQRGTCWSAGCHEAVHGSRVNSSLRF